MSVWVWCYDGEEIRFVNWQLRQVGKARLANVGPGTSSNYLSYPKVSW
jgi:hypothetical protein